MMILLKPHEKRIGKGLFEIAVACACKHRQTEIDTGETLQPWCSGTVAEYMRSFRAHPSGGVFEPFTVN